jgi:hypothetical protein
MPACGRQTRLRHPESAPSQRRPDRQFKVPGQLFRLIETSAKRTPGMERNGHDHVGPVEDLRPRLPHEARERLRERKPSFELERVNDLPQRAVIASGTAGDREAWWLPATPGTARPWRAPTGKGLATALAEGRRDGCHRAPAGQAHGISQRLLEHTPATGAWRGKQRANGHVGRSGEQ